MLGVVLLAAASPQPTAASPLKTITSVRASPFCTALHESVAPAMRGLIQNHAVIMQGKSLFLELARDEVSAPGWVDFEMERFGPVITGMVRNLEITDAALNELSQASVPAGSDDARRLEEIRRQLEAVADQQRAALNVFSGTYYSYSSNELLGLANPAADALKDRRDPSSTAAVQAETPIVVPAVSTSAHSTTAQTPAPASTPHVSFIDLGLADDTPFAHLFNALTTYQLTEIQLETRASNTVLDSASRCNSAQ